MPDTTIEEARRCPRCEQPSALQKKMRGKTPGQEVEIRICENERCKWFDTTWLVTINADGTIPVRQPGPKEFDIPAERMDTVGRHYIEQVQEEFKSGQARNPYSR